MSVFHTCVRYFELHVTTILWPLFDVFCHIGRECPLYYHYDISTIIKRVKFLPIRVRTRVDVHGYADTDRCSLAYASEWFASINGHGYKDTGARTRTGVAGPLRYCVVSEAQNLAHKFNFKYIDTAKEFN